MQNQVKKMFKADTSLTLQEFDIIISVQRKTLLHFFHNNFKHISYKLLLGIQLSRKDDENVVAFRQICTQNLQKYRDLLIRIVLSDVSNSYCNGL